MRYNYILCVSVAAGGALVAVSPAAADILHVPGDFPTIQEAIEAAVDGDEVEVHPGTYKEAIDFLGKAIRVYSTDGPDVTIIDAQQSGTVVTCDSAEGPDSVLEGFTITGGDATSGGGMRNINSSPTVTNCTFSGNTATSTGGGMVNVDSSPTVTNCTFTGNTAQSGAGMINAGGSPTVTNCTFSGNSASHGGGMRNLLESSPRVTNCTFSGNTASLGGGMYNTQASKPTLTYCTFSGNTATSRGGGMYNLGSSTTVTNCIFSGNISGLVGGGMHNWFDSSTTLTNCTFSGNEAATRGGGMYNRATTSTTVTNCTFSGNTASYGGGGISNSETSMMVTNCILWNDSPDEIENSNGSVAVSFSDVQAGYPGEGNIDADPLFVDPDNGDLRLMPGSPCIDAADNTAVPKGIVIDLDGNPRFVDDPCTDDTGNGDPPLVDMGAYEFQGSPCPWDLDCSGSVGVSDLLSLLASWGPCPPKADCPADFDGNGNVGVSDLLALLANWGPCP